MARLPFRISARILLVVCCIGLAPAQGQDSNDTFYRGKTMGLIIPIGPGGAYDAYGRLVARHLGKQLPGNPTIVARNMPGAGGMIASNHMFNVAPQDGTTLAIATSSFASEQLLDHPQIKYDARQFSMIGRLLDTTSVLFFWHESKIKTLDDLYKIPSTVALSSINDVPAVRARAINRLLGGQMKLVTGYPSARDYVLAVERGETDGGTSTYIGLSQLFSAYLREKKLNILIQFAAVRDPAMADVPTLGELAKDDGARRIFSILVSNDQIGRTLMTTPNVPPARVELLREAFDKMIKDPDFQAEAARANLPVAAKTGAEMQKVVAGTFDISPAELEQLRTLSQP